MVIILNTVISIASTCKSVECPVKVLVNHLVIQCEYLLINWASSVSTC